MKKRFSGWLYPLLFVSLSLHGAAQPTSPSSPTFLEQALQYVLDGRTDSALAMLNRQIEMNPEDARGYLARGTFLANILKEPRLLEVALADFNRSLELQPEQEAMFWLLRGRLLHRLDRHREAREDLNHFLSLDPANPDAYFLRARSQWLLGDGKAAENDLSRAIQLNPMMTEAYGLRGVVRLQLGQPDKGVQDLRDAVDLDPRSSYAEDLKWARQRKLDSDGMSWVPFRSPDRDFQVELPMPVRTTTKNDQYMVASALAGGHMYGVIRHPHDADSKRWKIESEECRKTVFDWLETRGGQVKNWNIESYSGKRCLHASLQSSDGTETDVIVVLGQLNIYLVAAVRPLSSPPFNLSRRDRFYRSFRLLK